MKAKRVAVNCRSEHCSFSVVIALCALLSSLAWGQSSGTVCDTQQTPEQIYVTIRIRPERDAARIVDALAQLSDCTTTVEVHRKVQLTDILRNYYGVSRKWFRDIVQKYNPGVFKKGEASETAIILPSGPKGTAEKTIIPTRRITLHQLAEWLMGDDGPTTQERVWAANPLLRGSWNTDVKGRRVVLPYTTEPVSYPLRTSSMQEAEQARQKLLKNDTTGSILSIDVGPRPVEVPQWTLAAAQKQTSDCVSADKPDNPAFETLPTDWSDLDNKKQGQAIVAIADTGIAEGDTRFRFWTNPNPASTRTVDQFSTQCLNDTNGCNFLNLSSFPLDDCNVCEDYHHGTHIAGLVSARLYQKAIDKVDSRVVLMILKVADAEARINLGDLSDAIRYAYMHNANIMNLSVTGPSSETVKDAIKDASNMLFVAAAGNPRSGVGIDLDDRSLPANTGFPAKLTALSPDFKNVISVAAQDPSGRMPGFSNFGFRSVDIAAPGVDIKSTIPGAQTAVMSGTSQATAIVSLAAALLYAQGLTTPADIKRRLLVASDFVPALRGKVFAEGTLNIDKALRFREDVIQRRDGSLVVGKLEPMKIKVPSELNSLTLQDVYKIVTVYSDEHGKKIRITVWRDGKLEHLYTDTIPTIRVKMAGSTVPFSTDEIRDIIPTHFGGTR